MHDGLVLWLQAAPCHQRPGEIIQWMLTPRNVDDREPLKDAMFTRKLFGKLLADRGYISQNLFEELFVDDMHLVTRIKKNMKTRS